MRTVREPAFWELREFLDTAIPDWPVVVLPSWVHESEVHNHSRPIHSKPSVRISDEAYSSLASTKEPTRILVLNLILHGVQLALSHGVTAEEVACALGSIHDPQREGGARSRIVQIPLGDLLRLQPRRTR